MILRYSRQQRKDASEDTTRHLLIYRIFFCCMQGSVKQLGPLDNKEKALIILQYSRLQ